MCFQTAEREAVEAAMNTWNSVKDLNGNDMVSMYLTTDYSANKIRWSESFGAFVGHSYPTRSGDELLSVDIVLARDADFSTSSEEDAYVRTIVLHELGHALCVAHCHESGDGPCWSATCLTNVMNPTTSKGSINRTLKAYDTSSYITIYW